MPPAAPWPPLLRFALLVVCSGVLVLGWAGIICLLQLSGQLHPFRRLLQSQQECYICTATLPIICCTSRLLARQEWVICCGRSRSRSCEGWAKISALDTIGPQVKSFFFVHFWNPVKPPYESTSYGLKLLLPHVHPELIWPETRLYYEENNKTTLMYFSWNKELFLMFRIQNCQFNTRNNTPNRLPYDNFVTQCHLAANPSKSHSKQRPRDLVSNMAAGDVNKHVVCVTNLNIHKLGYN